VVLPPQEFARKVAVSKLLRAYEGQVETPEDPDSIASDTSKSAADDFSDDD